MPRFLSKVCSFLAKHYDLVMLLTVSLIIFVSKTPIISSTPKITRNAIKHGPLFSKSSLVADYWSGDFTLAVQENKHTDLLVVYFYAPWDSQSLKASLIFDRVSEVFRDEVTFIAVNCWEPTGSCATQTRLTRFPAIAIYARGLLPVVYDGPLRADYLTAFVHRAFHPLHIIQSSDNVTTLFARYDNIVAGYFNFSTAVEPPGYFQFYAASMKLLSRSIASKHTVMAVIIGDGMMKKMNMTSSGQIAILRLNNSTLHVSLKPPPYRCSYIWQILLTPGNLQAPAVMWLQPSKVKSRHLDSALSIGPAAVLFLRHSPLTSLYHDLSKLRELALIYRTCLPMVQLPNRHHSRAHRTAEAMTSRRWRHACSQWRQLLLSLVPACRRQKARQRAAYWSTAWSRASNRCSVCGPDLTGPDVAGMCPSASVSECYRHRLGSPAASTADEPCHKPEPPPGSAQWKRQCSSAQRRTMLTEATRLWHLAEGLTPPANDPGDLRELQVGRRCRRLELADQLNVEPTDADTSDPPEGLDDKGVASRVQSEIGGLACRTNRSLNFFAIDDGLYPILTRQLGVNTTGSRQTLTVIDWKNEAVYAMNKDFKYVHAARFVSKFHSSSHVPVRRSDVPVKSFSLPLPVLPDFTTLTADEVVRKNKKETVVLYYYPSCGFCSMFMHKFRNLAHYFSNQNSIVFTRINVAKNDLPWNLRVENLPVIIFFPHSGTGRQPVVLNLNRHVTLADLVAFVLRSSTSKVFLRAASHVCGQDCLSANRERLINHLAKLEKSKTVSLELLRTASIRLEFLNSKLYGLRKFKTAVRDWLDWEGWTRETNLFSREFRLLHDFYNHRSGILKVYHQKITSVSRVIGRLSSNLKRPDVLWSNIIADAKYDL